MTSQVFHGLGFYWARHCGLFDLPDVAPLPSRNDTTNLVYEAWRGWIARESQLRSLLGMYILDGVISQYSGNPTFAQHMANQLPMPSDELAFSAISASEWLERQLQLDTYQSSLRFCDVFRVFFYPEEKLDNSRPPDLTFLALKVILEGLKSLVAESSRVEPHPVGVPSPEEINVVLDRIRGYIIAHSRLTLLERQTAMLRWHAICLDTWKVAARGARRLCFSHGITQHIFGGCERYETDIDPQRHIDKEDARRTLLHAREIQHIASQLPLGLAHDPHVPGAVFAAATTYAAFALAGKSRILFPIRGLECRGRFAQQSHRPGDRRVRNFHERLESDCGFHTRHIRNSRCVEQCCDSRHKLRNEHNQAAAARSQSSMGCLFRDGRSSRCLDLKMYLSEHLVLKEQLSELDSSRFPSPAFLHTETRR
jgi:hypothetical protein